MIGVTYPDPYAVEETFQLLKVPWEWYRPGRQYDVVIARKADLPGYAGNLIDLTDNDIFGKISELLNRGRPHLHEPLCDILLDHLRQELKTHTLLAEIPPAPWGHPYLMALTHDVDVTSVRECRLVTAGYAAFLCFTQGNIRAGFQLFLSRWGIGPDPWVLFERWKTLEEQLGVRSTFFFVPRKDDPGLRAHQYRAVGYGIEREILHGLSWDGWETGIHGIDNWADVEIGKQEMAAVGNGAVGNRTHWLLFDRDSWKKLDEAGYSYDTTFGYNDDVGFRAGTLQVYRPEGTSNIRELPLHIQDLGLFGKFCWAPVDQGWEKTACLHMDEPAARVQCKEIVDYALKYGGAVTILWHYENLTPPRDWSGMYTELVKRACADGAWVTTAGNVVEWFEARRKTTLSLFQDTKKITICIKNPEILTKTPLQVRLHIDPS
ncbi:MAG: hypothetical protein Q7T80_11215, partial [Methanoregula sp.]|nr:hypothetical protein [Methanoregula sp.]